MADEIVDQVDENDNIIGERLKSECHREGLWHRVAVVFVFNKDGELLIQKRGPNVRRPNLLTSSAAGHLHKGESYEEGAKRELFEELGIQAEVRFLGKLTIEEDYPNNEIEREYHALYICNYDGKIKIQEDELTGAQFYPLNKLKEMINENKDQFTFGFLEEFRHYLEWVENK
jgi:isopentenyl-diphosphate delta-isomerase